MINKQATTNQERPVGLRIVSILMIVFGLAEVATGITHNFLGIVSTTETNLTTYVGSALGLCYFTGGLLILTGRKTAAWIAIALLGIDVVGRIFMVITGLYPVNSLRQVIAIIIGTGIAAFFGIYVGTKLKYFK